MAELEELVAAANQIASLPKAVGRLVGLHHVDLGMNRIASLPEEVGSLSHLECLDLRSNQIISLPETIGGLQALVGLFLDENRLQDLPESLRTLGKLEKLHLDNNSLSALSNEVGQLPRVTELSVLGNRISALPSTTRKAVRSLEQRGCTVRLQPAPHQEIPQMFFPMAFHPQRPHTIWGFDLDGQLFEYNLVTSAVSKYIQIEQPALVLSYVTRFNALVVLGSDGTLHLYSTTEKGALHSFRYALQDGQRLAAAGVDPFNRIALIYTKADHSPAKLVLHDPLGSGREVAMRELGFGYFWHVPLEIDDRGNLITMEGEPPNGLVLLESGSLRVLRKFEGSGSYLIAIKLIDGLLFASNSSELLVWQYATGKRIYQASFGLIRSIAWSRSYNMAFLCTASEIVLLDTSTGKFLGALCKSANLDWITVSADGELLILGTHCQTGQRAQIDGETPATINQQLEWLAGQLGKSKQAVSLERVRSTRLVQIWKVSDVIAFCRDNPE